MHGSPRGDPHVLVRGRVSDLVQQVDHLLAPPDEVAGGELAPPQDSVETPSGRPPVHRLDETATHLVGHALMEDPAAVTPAVRDWATDADVWLRRTAVICQLRHGPDTDLDLLSYAIEANVDDPSFWLRKAIGWALRQHARTDPQWVLDEVSHLGDRLSPLSRREALKHLSGLHPHV